MGHHARRIEKLLDPQAIAIRAGACRIVEGKLPRLQFLQAVATMRTGQTGGEQLLGTLRLVHEGQHRQAVGQPQGGFQALSQTLACIRTHAQAVHHRLDTVLALGIELGDLLQFPHRAIHPRPHQTLVAQIDKYLIMFALAVLYHRRQQHDAQPLRQRQHLIDHLAHGLRRQRHTMLGAAWNAGPGIEQTQVIVDFGDGTHGRARVVGGGFLFDRNRRGQALDVIHVGLVHQREELARIGREGLDITPLAFGVEGVEGE
jgi:hypothetical protein